MADATPKCPGCGNPLGRVRRGDNSPLNRHQFDAVKAGDWFCAACKGDRGKTGFAYYWDREVLPPEPPAPPKTAGELVRRYWPDVREVYTSPLSGGDDVIVAWQVEVLRAGGRAEAVAAPTEAEALAVMDRALAGRPAERRTGEREARG